MAFKFYCGVFILYSIFSTASCITYYYMDNHCHDTVDISSDYQARIQTTAFGDYSRDMSCVMRISGEDGSRLMVFFKDLDMEYACSNDWFRMHDGYSTSDSYIGKGKYCGSSYPSTVYKTSGSDLTLEFKSDSSIQGRGFDIVVTQFTTGINRNIRYCYSWEFSCNNGRCVDESLVCDGYNPCGDNSDCPIAAGTIVGAVVGSLCFLIFCVATILICRRRRARLVYARTTQPAISTTVTSATVNTSTQGFIPPTQAYGPPPAYDTLQYGYNAPVPNQYPQPAYPQQQQYAPQYPAQEMRMPTAAY